MLRKITTCNRNLIPIQLCHCSCSLRYSAHFVFLMQLSFHVYSHRSRTCLRGLPRSSSSDARSSTLVCFVFLHGLLTGTWQRGKRVILKYMYSATLAPSGVHLVWWWVYCDFLAPSHLSPKMCICELPWYYMVRLWVKFHSYYENQSNEQNRT